MHCIAEVLPAVLFVPLGQGWLTLGSEQYISTGQSSSEDEPAGQYEPAAVHAIGAVMPVFGQ